MGLSKDELLEFVLESFLEIKVVANASRTLLIVENGKLKVYLKSVPVKGKANLELVKLFKRKYGLQVAVVKGETSRIKVLEIL